MITHLFFVGLFSSSLFFDGIAALREGGLIDTYFERNRRTYIGSNISPDGTLIVHATRGNYRNQRRYYELSLEEKASGRTHKVFSGDPRINNWEWTEDNKLKISYNCGTGCLASKILDSKKFTVIPDHYRGEMLNEKNGWTTEFFYGMKE